MTVKLSSRLQALSILLIVHLSSCQLQADWLATPTLPVSLSATPTSFAASTVIPDLLSKPGKQSGLIVSLDAPVLLKRDGWRDYQKVGFGTVVFSNDLLNTKGKILLFCAGEQTIETFMGLDRNPCPLPTTNNFLIYDGMLFDSGTRAAPSNSIPYILYPRGTAILDPQPVLRWNHTGASSYTVKIQNEDQTVWEETNATGDSFTYPTDAPVLKPGTTYLLVVTDNDTGRSSDSDPNKGLGFEVAGSEQRVQIETQKKAIWNVTDLDPVAQKMVIALFFEQIDIQGRGLWGEAAALLEEVSSAKLDAPVVRLYRGACLARMKLWREATSEYETALIQAEALDHLESQVEAQVALWRITGDESRYQEALKLYTELGSQDQVEALKKEHP